MSDLKASGRKGGFQSLRRTLDRPIWLQWINWYKHSPAPHPVVMCWWCPRDAECPDGAPRMVEQGETGKMQALSTQGSRDLSMEMATGFYIGLKNYLGATPAYY